MKPHNMAKLYRKGCLHSEDPGLVEVLAVCSSLNPKQQLDTFEALKVNVSRYCLLLNPEKHSEDHPFEDLICILQEVRKKKKLEHARHVHAQICNDVQDSFRPIGNFIVPMFVECGSLSEGQQTFNNLVNPSQHSWNSLLLGYVGCGQAQHALNLHKRMQEDSVHPNSHVFAALLRASTKVGNVQSGREIHVKINKMGLDGDLTVGNSLLHMYAKCFSLSEAQEVFDRLPVRDVVSWTTLIASYVENGLFQEALKCFKQMQMEDVSPNAVSFICILKACHNLAGIQKAKAEEVHREIAQRGLETDLTLANALIDMYAKLGYLIEARQIFGKLQVQDVVSWTSLIAGYTEQGRGQEALIFYEQMQMNGIPSNAVTFVCCLKACCAMGAIHRGREIHAEIRMKGFEGEPFIASTLIHMYVQNGSLGEACEVFEKLPVQDTVSCNALIAGYAETGLAYEVFKWYEYMQSHGIPTDVATFVSIFKYCCPVGALDKCREMHAEIVRKGSQTNNLIGNCLVNMYIKSESLAEAHEVFDRLPSHDLMAWKTLVAGLAENQHYLEALKCFEQMKLEGVSPDAVSLVYSVKACINIGAVKKGRKIHAEIAQLGFYDDIFVGNALIDMYAECGSISEVEEMFDRLPSRDVVTWTILMAKYIENGFHEEALRISKEMYLENIVPNSITFMYLLKACGNTGRIHKGHEIHAEIVRRGLQRNFSIGSKLITMYSKCGSIAEARQVFGKLADQDVVSWNALIIGYIEAGLDQEVLKCFDQMQLEGITPNLVTLACLLKTCGILGAIDKGHEIHSLIACKGLERDLLIGSALVDMYAKCGLLAEARKAFDELPIPDIVSWTALIRGYAESGHDQEALQCFEQMLREDMFPDAVTFTCILKCCTNTGAIDKGREIHAKIRQKGFEGNLFISTSLIDMYAKAGCLLEAREVFDILPIQSVALWNAMIRGYGTNHEGCNATQCFEEMQQHGIRPDAVTFTCLLSACSHAGLLLKGCMYFNAMAKYGIAATAEHYTCLIDLFGRSGYLHKSETLLKLMPCPPTKEALTALLSACKIYGDTGLGSRCFQELFQLNPEEAPPYALMANIYAISGKLDDAINLDKEMHEFVMGNDSNEGVEIYAVL